MVGLRIWARRVSWRELYEEEEDENRDWRGDRTFRIGLDSVVELDRSECNVDRRVVDSGCNLDIFTMKSIV